MPVFDNVLKISYRTEKTEMSFDMEGAHERCSEDLATDTVVAISASVVRWELVLRRIPWGCFIVDHRALCT